jgi:glycosyltransferase involved in cell wall biosynthesis
MKIAAFYSDSPFAGWVQAEGFCDVLKRMGHEVVPIAVPPVKQVSRTDAERINKPIDDAELVIVSGPEHLRAWITTFYPHWSKLKAPKVGWYHESFVREDYSLDYPNFESMFDFHFFPDRNDAQKYKGEWLPLGVDTEMFKPASAINPTVTLAAQSVSEHDKSMRWTVDERGVHYAEIRDIEVGFIGLMYPKRARFVEELNQHLGEIKIQYRCGYQSELGLRPAIAVYEFDGLNVRRSMELLAEAYRRIKVFVTFPSLSSVLVAKVLESMACGCRLVAPKQPVALDGYFPYEGAKQCAEQIRKALHADVAPNVQSHRMELRFEQILSTVGVTA